MLFSVQVILAWAFIALSLVLQLATTTPIQTPRDFSFTINQVPATRSSSRPYQHKGLAAYAKAIHKHGTSKEAKDMADHLSKLAMKFRPNHGHTSNSEGSDVTSGSGSTSPIVAEPFAYDKEYTSPGIVIGNQSFVLDFDTGSSDLWVWGSQSRNLLPNQTAYSPGPSSHRLAGETFSVQYNDGSMVSGTVYTDTVNIGGLSVEGQAIEVVRSWAGDFAQEDGILGLGFDGGNQVYPDPQPTLFTNLLNHSLLGQPVLSADLKHQQAGCYTFGSIPTWQYTGSISYVPVETTAGLWNFGPSAYGVGNGTLNTSSSAVAGLAGVADTGTSLIVIDDSIAQAYWKQVPSARMVGYIEGAGYQFACKDAGTLPDFKIQIGQGTVSVPGEYMNYQPNGDGTCYGGIQPNLGMTNGLTIWGDVFLKSAFVVFDRGTTGSPRIGFATKA